MKLFKLLAPCLLSFALLSCSSLHTKKEQDYAGPLVLQQASNDVSIYETDKRLVERLQEVQLKGKAAQEFLASELYLKAADASYRGETELAVVLFKHLVSLKPEDSFIAKKYSAELIRFGKLHDAEKVLARLFHKNNKDEAIGLVLGGIYTALNENKKAEGAYEVLLKNNPKNEEACVLLGKSFFMQKKTSEALKVLDQCEKKIKNSGIFSYYKGKFLLEESKKAEAIKAFNNSLKLEPTYYQAVLALGMLSEEKEDWKSAAKVYKKFLESNGDSYPVLTRYVQILFVLEEYSKVIPYAEKLSSIDSSDLNLKLRLGVLYAEAKRYEEAKSAFKEILVAVPDSDKVLYYLGSLEEMTGDFDSSVAYFSKVGKESPLFHDTSVQMAKIYYSMALHGKKAEDSEEEKEKHSKSLRDFVAQRVGETPKLNFDLSLILSNYYEAKENFSSAIDVILGLREKKEFEESHQYYLASLYEKNKEQEKARDIVKEILKKTPKNANALNFLGYSYLEEGTQLDQAYHYISKAVALKPQDGYIRDSLGWYYYKKGDLARALVEMKKAWEMAKGDVVITKHLAIVHQDMRNYEEAKRYYVEALKNCKIESERIDVLKSMESLEKVRLPASAAEK